MRCFGLNVSGVLSMQCIIKATMHGVLSMAVAIGVGAGVVTGAQAQNSATQSAVRDYSIPAGALGQALLRFGGQSGLQFSVDSKLTNGKRTSGIKGRYSTEDALRALLAGSGLAFRYTGPRTVVIETLPNTSDARVLGPLRIEGAESRFATNGTNGVNGSTDITATEGTSSYTSGAMRVGTKTPASIKDTAQSVSVMTRKQIEDQNLTDVYQALEQAPGLSMVTHNSGPSAPSFFSRGFEISRFQVDGGAAMDMSTSVEGMRLSFDTAMYDHVEVLRGADGLFNGYGRPGGVVNLTRKRPLDHSQVIVEAQYGSWNNTRIMLDVSEPLGFDGRLRGRLVLARQDRDFFYKIADRKSSTLYGVVEADLRPGTLASFGFSHSGQKDTPWRTGLPRYEDGRDLGLSRDTCLCLPWSRQNISTTEVFGRIEQELGRDWSLKANLTRIDQSRKVKMGSISGAVNPGTRLGPTMSASMTDYARVLDTVDASLSGTTHWFGQRQEFVFGANYSSADLSGYTSYPSLIAAANRPAVDVFDFDPWDPRFREPPSKARSSYYPKYVSKQWGAYVNLKLTFFERLHFSTGVRYSADKSDFAGTQSFNPVTGEQSGQGAETARRTHNFSWPPTYNLSYDLGSALTVYASYADIYELQDQYVDHSLKSLDPRIGSNIEAGLKFSLRDGQLNAVLSAYRLQQKNFTLWVDYGDYASTLGAIGDGVHTCCYLNRKDLAYASQGLDFELSGELVPRLQVSVSYAWNENGIRLKGFGKGDPLESRSPRHLFKLWADYRFDRAGWLGRLSLGGGVNTRTSTYTTGLACLEYIINSAGKSVCAPDRNVPYEFTQSFNAVFAARATYRVGDMWTAALNIDNLTDRHYYQTPGASTSGNWYGEPRNFMLTLRGSF